MNASSGGAMEAAFIRLMSLRDGDRGVVDVVALGRSAIPALRALLFRREPSGLYQPRCHVVEALARLGAQDLLIEFLKQARPAKDPVEDAGEEAVLNAAARSLGPVEDQRMFPLMLSLAETRLLSGPITVLGMFQRDEALPCLIRALEDDVARPAAEDAIRKFGARARSALLEAASDSARTGHFETESSRRRRRAVLSLLLELGDEAQVPPVQASALVGDEDHVIAVLGCRVVLEYGTDQERWAAVQRLIGLLPVVHWLTRRDIESCLVRHPNFAGSAIARLDHAPMPEIHDVSPQAEARRAIRRIGGHLDPPRSPDTKTSVF